MTASPHMTSSRAIHGGNAGATAPPVVPAQSSLPAAPGGIAAGASAPDVPAAKPYYEDDAVTIYHGDCREILPSLAADVMVTDPPYGVSLAGKSTKWTARSGAGYASFEDAPDLVERDVIPFVASVTTEMRAVITPGLRMMWSYPTPAAVGAIFYPSGAGPGRWGFTCWQPIFYYGKCPYLAAGMGSRPDSFSTTAAAEPNGHPVPKPIHTMRWLVQKGSLPGETVIDPYAGSGTTLRAAKDLGRRAIGIEIEERYCEIAAKRCAQDVLDLDPSSEWRREQLADWRDDARLEMEEQR